MFRDKRPAHQLALFGVLLALTIALSWVERVIALDVILPGAKLGLANLVVLLALYTLPSREAAIFTVLKIALTGMLFGTGYSMAYSLAGGVLSFLCMLLCRKTGRTTAFTSVVGGVTHNVGQLIAARVILGAMGVVAYFPVLLLAGLGAGGAIGVVGGILLRRLRPMLDQKNGD